MTSLSRNRFQIPRTMDTWYILLKWIPLKIGLKGIVDGSSAPSSSSGGGIVRTEEGNVLIAFSNYYGSVTNNEVEMRVISDLI